MDVAPGTVINGRFNVVCAIGSGGMGSVFKATQFQLNRTVALKILMPGLASDSDYLERFAREAKAMARLTHQNIVQFLAGLQRFALAISYANVLKLRMAARDGASLQVLIGPALELVERIEAFEGGLVALSDNAYGACRMLCRFDDAYNMGTLFVHEGQARGNPSITAHGQLKQGVARFATLDLRSAERHLLDAEKTYPSYSSAQLMFIGVSR